MTDVKVTPFTFQSDVARLDLGEPRLRASVGEGDVYEASHGIWQTDRSGFVKTGVWECTPGTLASTRVGWSEVCHFISGRATITTEGGESVEVGPGDAIVLPEGWRGTWQIHETIRKFFVFQRYENYQG